MRRFIAGFFLVLLLPLTSSSQVLKTEEQKSKLLVVGFTDAFAKNAAYQLPNAAVGYKVGWKNFGFSPFLSGHSLGAGIYLGADSGLFAGAGFKFWSEDRRGDTNDSTRMSLVVGAFSVDGRKSFSKWHAGGYFDTGILGESNRKELPRFYVSRSFLDFGKVQSLGNVLHVGPYVATTGLGANLSFGPERKIPFRAGVGVGLKWDELFNEDFGFETNVFFGFGL